MNRGLATAWLTGEALVIWRMVHRDHRLPVPGALLGITGLFVVMGAIAEVVPRAATLMTVTAWGLDLAALFNALPSGLGGQLERVHTASAQAEGMGQPAQTFNLGGPPVA